MSRVTVSIASVPERMASLAVVTARLKPQVDYINIYLNGYQTVPPFLMRPEITVARSQHHGDIGDAGKFFWSGDVVGYHFTCDDDILYPVDYVQTTLQWLKKLGGAVVGYHGALMLEPFVSYYRSRHTFHYRLPLEFPTPVHVIGTGTLCYRTGTIQARLKDFKRPNMADVWFALLGQQQKVPFVCLPRSAGWLGDLPGTAESSIYTHSKRQQRTPRNTGDAQTQAVKTIEHWQTYPMRQT